MRLLTLPLLAGIPWNSLGTSFLTSGGVESGLASCEDWLGHSAQGSPEPGD